MYYALQRDGNRDMQDILKSVNHLKLGQRLQSARKTAGFTQQNAANQLQISRTTLTAIEKGERKIRPDELMQLSKLYHKSVNQLLQREVSQASFKIQFRQSLAKIDEIQIEAAIEQFQQLCEDYLYLEKITDTPLSKQYPPSVEIGFVEPVQRAEDVANLERIRLGLSDGPGVNIKNILENDVGIRIFGMPLPSQLAGIFTCSELFGACIAVNTKHPRDRQLLSLMHEYGHFLTTRTIADVVILKNFPRLPASERFAEAFARIFLLPTSGLQRRFHEIQNLKKGKITPADLLRLADQYAVSFQSLLLRLEELRLIPTGSWEKLIKIQKFQIRKAQNILGISSKTGSNDFELPYRYLTLAAQAFGQAELSEGQLAKLLHTDRIRAREIINKLWNRTSFNEQGDEVSVELNNISWPISEFLKGPVGSMVE